MSHAMNNEIDQQISLYLMDTDQAGGDLQHNGCKKDCSNCPCKQGDSSGVAGRQPSIQDSNHGTA